MKKYIHLAKVMKPNMTSEASSLIAEEYTRLRGLTLDSHVARTSPITARTLETLIRLSTAHARSRMSMKVEAQDVKPAIELVQFAYFKRVLEKKKRRRGVPGDDGSDNEEEDDAMEDDENPASPAAGENGEAPGEGHPIPKKPRQEGVDELVELGSPENSETVEDDTEPMEVDPTAVTARPDRTISDER